MQKSLRETARAVLSQENSKEVKVGEFRNCKLIGVDTKYGITNNTPMLTLVYEFTDTGEYGEDIYCFTDNSLETVIKRLNKAYQGFTKKRLEDSNFDNAKILKTTFENIIGNESLVKKYINIQGFTNYQHYVPNEDEVYNNENNFWDDIEEIINNSVDKNITSTKAINLEKELEESGAE